AEEKYKAIKTVKNYSHIVITTNNDWAAAIGSSDRRYVAIEMSTERVGDKAYFKELHDWIDNDGVEIALDYFLNKIDISDFDPRTIPAAASTGSKLRLDQQIRTANYNLQFLLSLLETREFRYKQGDKNYKEVGEITSDQENAGLYWNNSGECFIQWVGVYDFANDCKSAELFLPKDVLVECYKEFCKGKRGGSVDDKNLLGRFIKGKSAGSKGNVFAKDSQAHQDVLKGRKWHFIFNDLLIALEAELGTSELGELYDEYDLCN
ncbi:MAG: hypothetical protein KAI17_21795, partial [Thiotrichaceae bacterium]|nr:hypothetical protein [Thiotrichaceae bacterium]